MLARRAVVALLAAALAASAAAAAAPAPRPPRIPCFRTPLLGLFVQENVSAALTAPGQHPSFGARAPWPDIRAAAAACAPRCRLVLLVRHGQADSNVVQAAVGQAAWDGGVGHLCAYQGTPLFDAALTPAGAAQAAALGSILASPGGLSTLLGSPSPLPPPAVVASPLARALATADLALSPSLPRASFHVSDLARERLGVNTCDARRPAADGGASACGPQAAGLRSLFQGEGYDGFPVVGRGTGMRLGLVSDADSDWTPGTREPDVALVARAAAMLDAAWNGTPPGAPLVVVSHSGFVPAALAAAGRARYPPQNAELVPALIERCSDGA